MEIKGATTENELSTLYKLAKKIPRGGSIVELGAYKGRATAWLANGAKEGNAAKVYPVDLFETTKVDNWLDEYKDNVKGLEEVIEIIVSDTVAASCGWNKGKVDMMFIDGDHSYEGILGDFGSWYKHLKIGGVVAFHDTTPVIREILRGVPMRGFWGIRKVVTDLVIRSDKFRDVHLTDSMLYAAKCERRTFLDSVQSYGVLLKMRFRYGIYKAYRLITALPPGIKTNAKKLLGIKVRKHYREDAHRHY